MTKQIVELGGVRPRPLADYLKSIGILRLVCEQTDASATGWWNGEVFCLASELCQEGLCDFLLHQYEPTPLIAPWNGGSGFFKADQKGAWNRGFKPLMNSSAPRFASYRHAIDQGRELLGDRDKKFDAKESDLKDELLRRASFNFRGKHADWLHAALIIDGDGSPVYPAMLGTGGNDGRLDFTNNFMQRLAELFDLVSDNGEPAAETRSLLRESLFGEPTCALQSSPIGQFAPGSAGGVNSGFGFRTSPKVNPFDFVLMLEGAIAFTPAISRRASSQALPQASAPFAVYSGTGGYSTSVPDEKNRGEQWMPIWNRPTGFDELQTVLGEARCRVGSSSAKRPRDVAQAIARSGVSNGISAFERFAYLERNGQANLAVSLGRWNVEAEIPYLDLLTEIGSWVERLERASRGKTAPASWAYHAKVIDDALMDCCRTTSTPRTWQRLLISLGEAEITILRNPRAAGSSRQRPLFYGTRGLSSRWIDAASDGSAEMRLAVALACQAGPHQEPNRRPIPNWNDPIRRHFIPMSQLSGSVKRPHTYAANDETLADLTEVVVRNVDPVADLTTLVERRIRMTQRRNDWNHFAMVPTCGLEATPIDIQRWIDRELDDNKILCLARTLLAVDWNEAWKRRESITSSLGIPNALRETSKVLMSNFGWGAIRLCFHWDDLRLHLRNASHPESMLRKDVAIAIDPKIFANLNAGRSDDAVQFAARRLRASGLPVRVASAIASPEVSRRWAASLAWSISHSSVNSIAARIVHRAGVRFDAAVQEV